MKYKIFSLLLLATLCMPVQAQVVAQQDSTQQLLRGLMQLGAQAVQKQIEKRMDAAPDSAQAQQNAQTAAAAGMMSLYKAEGRKIAQQLGETIADRILADERVQHTLSTLKLLAIGLVSYLTLVTFALLIGLRGVRKSNQRILELLEAKQKSE